MKTINKRPAILVVDDDPVFLTLATSCLAASGFDARVACDGVEALERLQCDTFHLAMIDLAMPRIDGFRLIGLVRSTPHLARLGILVVSGRQDLDAFNEALRLGANGFLTKPIDWSLMPLHAHYMLRSLPHAA
jgi:CheY-like chemotaxis protein